MPLSLEIPVLEDHSAVGLPSCRFCGHSLRQSVIDLGMSPLCESYVPPEKLNAMEPFYPLHVHVCDHCFLVQLEEYVSAESIFSEYAYFSSCADSWVSHARDYVKMITRRLGLNRDSLVVELASNDGYLLQHFIEDGIPILGIEPARNIAEVAIERGVPTLVEFFGVECADRLVAQGRQADLIAGNNVLAQVPDLNDFVAGVKRLLKPGGVATFEFPHLLKLIRLNQFDTIYHEHFSYFSFITSEKIFAHHGLTLFDVDQIPTHGGSLRIYACHAGDPAHPVEQRARDLHALEIVEGLDTLEAYRSFTRQVEETKRKILEFLIQARRAGKQIAGYGAPGKGNTLLNYCGIRGDFIEYTVDRNTYKQGKFLPGTRIPILHPDRISQTQPDYVFILPWNFKDEIMRQLAYIREWDGRFVVPIPELTVFD